MDSFNRVGNAPRVDGETGRNFINTRGVAHAVNSLLKIEA